MFMSKFIWKEIELCAGNSEKTNVRTFNIIELLFVQYRFGLAFDFKPCLFLKTFHNFGHDDAVFLLRLALPKTGFASQEICEYWTVV